MSKNTQKILRIASYITLAIVNIAGIVLTFLNAFQCNPVTAAYKPDVNGTCISIVTLFLCSAPVNIITDLAILVLPIPVLTGMRLPQRQKTILVVTFALGIFVTVVDVIRIYYLQQASDDQIDLVSKMEFGTGFDFAYYASPALMWSAVEVNVGIICACIPTLKPLIKRILPSMITDRSKTGSDHTASYSSKIRPSDEPQRNCVANTRPPELQPLPPAQFGADPEQEMGMMDFLTTPGMDPSTVENNIARTHTAHTHATENTMYFGFIDMKRPKSMLKLKGRESFKYCTVVTILFFLWGFSYGLLNILNNEIGEIAHQSQGQILGLSAAYFGAYFFGPLTVGQWVLRRGGFKATFICGLCIYGTGTLMFWPSAVLTSFPGFIICQFVVGFGLSILETAANPFLALCGPSQYAECRLLLAQGVQAIGTVLSQILAQKVLFGSLVNHPSLIDVQWTYLAVTLFTVILALFFYYMPLPEASDADLQQLCENLSIFPSRKLLRNKLRIANTRLPLIYTTLSLAVFAQFLYVGAQESVSDWFGALISSLSPSGPLTLSINDYSLVGHSTFAIGRFLFAPLCLIIPPRILLLAIFILSIIFSILLTTLHVSANAIAAPMLLLLFLEGPVWPLVFAIGLRGMGRHTKWAASALTAAASGGAIFPFVMWAVQKINRRSIQYSYCVVIALFVFGAIFSVYLNFVPSARHQVDPAKLPKLGGVLNGSPHRGGDGRPDTPIRRLSRHFSIIISKIGRVTGKSDHELPVVEHVEREMQTILGDENGHLQ